MEKDTVLYFARRAFWRVFDDLDIGEVVARDEELLALIPDGEEDTSEGLVVAVRDLVYELFVEWG